MSATAMQLPQDVEYTDLSPSDVAFIQQTVPIDARMNGLVAQITVAAQPNGLSSVTIHYAAATPPAAAVGAAAARAAPSVAWIPAAPPAATPPVAPVRAGAVPAIVFTAGGRPLQQPAFAKALSDLGNVEASLLWALLNQEGNTPPVGFLSDRRPKILFERHIFAAHTNGRYNASHPDISGPPYTEYGSFAKQYDRLGEAMALDQDAALQACSWGIAQVLGENFANVGFVDAATMVQAMIVTEDAQVDACVRYVLKTESQGALANQEWQDFARTYNGPGNITAYAASLEAHYNACHAAALPNIRVRAVQLMLTLLGHPLAIDGIPGAMTTGAIRAYQQMAGIVPADGTLTDAVYAHIQQSAFP